MKARFTSVAETELREAMEFYESAQSGLGAEFLAEIQATTRLIESHPLAWTNLSLRTHRFPYGLFYQVRTDEILIVSVMDLRRDPKRWEEHL